MGWTLAEDLFGRMKALLIALAGTVEALGVAIKEGLEGVVDEEAVLHAVAVAVKEVAVKSFSVVALVTPVAVGMEMFAVTVPRKVAVGVVPVVVAV